MTDLQTEFHLTCLELRRRRGELDKTTTQQAFRELSVNELIKRAKAIYGQDTRNEVESVQTGGGQLVRAINATGGLAHTRDLTVDHDGRFVLQTEKFGVRYNLCADEPFFDQPCGVFGSCFLVGPDLIATAAHCIQVSQDPCAGIRVIFDFQTVGGQAATTFSAEQVFEISRVERIHKDQNGADWAIVRLSRNPNRDWLHIRDEGAVNVGTELYVVGHPCGLPKKHAGQARVQRADDPNCFFANLDTFGGNSGSPVINSADGRVEGILVRGAKDFIYNTGQGCNHTTNFDISHGREAVCRSTLFASFLKSKFKNLSKNRDVEELIASLRSDVGLSMARARKVIVDFLRLPDDQRRTVLVEHLKLYDWKTAREIKSTQDWIAALRQVREADKLDELTQVLTQLQEQQ